MSDFTVTYEGHELHLTRDEYLELQRAAIDDPIEAQRLALAHLARQQASRR